MNNKTEENTRKKPTIVSSKIVADSRLFMIEELELEFSNGNKRYYERIKTRSRGAVLIIPMIDDKRFYMVREYAAGLDSYELSLPKGLIDQGETALEAASRELKEEVGYGAKNLLSLQKLSSAPGYFCNQLEIILAQDLYPEKLVGDEPEDLDIVEWHIDKLPELLLREDFSHAISLAALYLVRDRLQQYA